MEKQEYKDSILSVIIPIVLTLCMLILISDDPAYSEELNFNAIKQIESSGNTFSYNKHSQARGLYQITPICLKDYNQFHKVKYTVNQLFNPQVNTIVAKWYLTARIPMLLRLKHEPWSINNVLIAYNCGIACIGKPLPKETKNYIIKYNKLNK